MTPAPIRRFLGASGTELAARLLLTFPFWGSGLAKLIDFPGGVAEMEFFGFAPGWLFNGLTILVQLGGSALILSRRMVWLGAGALGVFTGLTILLVHRFWAIEGPMSVVAFHTATEHVGMIGALVLVSVLALRASPAREGAPLARELPATP
jgi:transmembrane protein